MKTNGNYNQAEENIRVPLDMVPDIFDIIVSERLGHEITEASRHRWYFIMTLFYDKTQARSVQAAREIQRLLEEYHTFRSASHNELNWR